MDSCFYYPEVPPAAQNYQDFRYTIVPGALTFQGPGAAQERPKGPGGAQKGSPDAKTIGSYQAFAPPSFKSDGLAAVFK